MNSMLVPFLQPIQDLENNQISHYEALARMRMNVDDNGHWPLLKLAERYKFIGHLDMAMLGKVLDLLGRNEDIVIAVNISVVTIETMLHEYLMLLDVASHVLDRLIVEITETSPIMDVSRVSYFVRELRSKGCRVALDDFGNRSGWITHALVETLQPEFLKLDRDVLTGALNGGKKFLNQAVSLAENVGSRVIAEYVDSTEKVRVVRSAGIKYAQGMIFGMPQNHSFLLGGAVFSTN
jgi:EAL domain-containing protein (putative c-di-GMP-specific phosphodiesterase class I)